MKTERFGGKDWKEGILQRVENGKWTAKTWAGGASGGDRFRWESLWGRFDRLDHVGGYGVSRRNVPVR